MKPVIIIFALLFSQIQYFDSWQAPSVGVRVNITSFKNRRDNPAQLTARNAHALAFDEKRKKTVLFGGADAEKVLNETWEFDGKKWSPIFTKEAPSPRTFPTMAYDAARRKTLLFGGNRVLFGKDKNDYEFLNDFWEYDGKNWRKIAVPTPPRRAEASFVFDGERQRAVLFGGYRIENGEMIRLHDTWKWDGKSWEKA